MYYMPRNEASPHEIGTNTTLTTSEMMRFSRMTVTTAGITVTLPTAARRLSQYYCSFYNESAGDATIAGEFPNSVTTITLPAYATVVFQCWPSSADDWEWTTLNNRVDHNHAADYAAIDHDATHITSGTDEIDGDKLDVDYAEQNYAAALVTGVSTSLDHLASHLRGIDNKLAAIETAENNLSLLAWDTYSTDVQFDDVAVDDFDEDTAAETSVDTHAGGVWDSVNHCFHPRRTILEPTGVSQVTREDLKGTIGYWDFNSVRAAWSGELVTTGTKPAARRYHSAVVYGDYMYIFGGYTTTVVQDTHRLNLITFDWSGELATTGTKPSVRDMHTAVVYGDYMYIFGGYSGSSNLQETHRLNLTTLEWSGELVTTGTKPAARRYHTSVVHGGYMYVFGGFNGSTYYQDTHRLNLTTLEWSGALTTTGTPPSARAYHTSVVHGGYMYVFGGFTGSYVQDTLRLNLTTLAWEAEATSGTKPTARAYSPSVVCGGYMYVLGGTLPGADVQDTHRLNLTSLAWSGEMVSIAVNPAARQNHTAVVYGDYMYIFGGNASAVTQDTHRLCIASAGKFKTAVDGDTVTVGVGGTNTAVLPGTQVVIGGTEYPVIATDGTGDVEVIIQGEVADAAVTGIYGLTHNGSGVIVGQVLSAEANGANNTGTGYATVTMTANNAPVPQVASATSENGTDLAWKAIDQTVANCWIATAAPTSEAPQSLMVDFGAGRGVAINKYAIQAMDADADRNFPRDWTLQATNNTSAAVADAVDANDWLTLDTRVDIADPGKMGMTAYYTFTNQVPYRYWRIRIVDRNDAGALVAINTFKLVPPTAKALNPVTQFVAHTTDTSQLITTSWPHLNTASVTQTLQTGSTCYHAVSFDDRATFWVYMSSAWRQVVKFDSVWQYQDNAEAWQNATVNTLLGALAQGFALTDNQWTEALIEAMVVADWEKANGFVPATTATVDWAVALTAATIYIPRFDKVTFSTGVTQEDLVLVTDSWEATANDPDSAYCVLKVKPVDTITYGTDVKAYVSMDNGSHYEELAGLSAFRTIGAYDYVRGDATGLTARTDKTMRLKVETDNLKDAEVHAIALGAKWNV